MKVKELITILEGKDPDHGVIVFDTTQGEIHELDPRYPTSINGPYVQLNIAEYCEDCNQVLSDHVYDSEVPVEVSEVEYLFDRVSESFERLPEAKQQQIVDILNSADD